MRPPYDITPKILRWVSSISEKIGEANALFLSKPSPQLRKQNQIKTIQSSLQVAHLAPPAENVPGLMKDLFRYLKEDNELDLIKSCVFHYELEFIHPFQDGNGRMGRLWQTVILKEKYPVFESLPFETLISKTQNDYYQALAESDKSGKSTIFIEYMLQIIDLALNNLLKIHGKPISSEDRITYFLSLGKNQFTRKEYMEVFKSISTATASRDLKKAVENGIFKTEGIGNQTIYAIKPTPPKNP